MERGEKAAEPVEEVVSAAADLPAGGLFVCGRADDADLPEKQVAIYLHPERNKTAGGRGEL